MSRRSLNGSGDPKRGAKNNNNMIDLIKAKFLNKEVIEQKVLAERGSFPVDGFYSYTDAEKKYPIRSRRDNMFINITNKGATIENSLHKYFNNSVSDENQNFNDFYFCDIVYALDVLEHELQYSLSDTAVTRLEFGFNIDLDICPTQFLNHNVLFYDTKSPCYDPKNDRFMKIKKFMYSEYEIKLYNKTLDHSRYKMFATQLLGTQILRIEVKFKSKKILNNMGIYGLNDLKKPIVYKNLMAAFLLKYDNLLIIDSFDGNSNMTKKERKFIIESTHPNYWIKLKEVSHRNTVTNQKKKMEKFIVKYGLNSWKNQLRNDIINKFEELMNFNCIEVNTLSLTA